MYIFSFLFLSILATVSSENYASDKAYTPVVLWHGMGDSCCNPFSMGSVKRQLRKAMPGVYVLSLKIGKTMIDDTTNGFLLHPDKQIEMACDIIKSEPLLAGGYNAIGFSQGAQFLRGLVQRCPFPQMKNLASLGGQHQGVYGIPNCDASTDSVCDKLRQTASKILYSSIVQENFVQATYWHDPLNETAYLKENTFLTDINNEIVINQTYVDNLQSLQNLILIKFEADTMVQPKESQWFQFYKSGQSKEVEPLEESRVYDRLGLRKMNIEGKLQFLSTPGDHLQINWSWFTENVINKYFK